MATTCDTSFDTTVLSASALLALALGGGSAPLAGSVTVTTGSALTGVWLSADAGVRVTLRADGSYDFAVTGRKRPGRGTFAVDGAAVLLTDVSGLRTPALLDGDVLWLAGHELTRA